MWRSFLTTFPGSFDGESEHQTSLVSELICEEVIFDNISGSFGGYLVYQHLYIASEVTRSFLTTFFWQSWRIFASLSRAAEKNLASLGDLLLKSKIPPIFLILLQSHL